MRTIDAAILILSFGAVALGSGVQAMPPSASLGAVIDLQARARQAAAAYGEVRAAVETGKRPASDLEAARRSLTIAQAAMYDQIDAARESNAAVLKDLRRRNARRLKDGQAWLLKAEIELASAGEAERPPAGARVRLARELLEGYRQDAERFAARPAAPPRPRLPVLPPRSN
jgi:hypothetical protein